MGSSTVYRIEKIQDAERTYRYWLVNVKTDADSGWARRTDLRLTETSKNKKLLKAALGVI